jgi:hypothetical protein
MFKVPVSMGRIPITAVIIPLVPPTPSKPHAINPPPARIRIIRPAGDAKKLKSDFIFFYLSFKNKSAYNLF